MIYRIQDYIEIKKIKQKVPANISVIAKIETEKGLDNVGEIAQEADGILFGRGDLALYSDLHSLIGKMKLAITKSYPKKIIFCTGILQNFNYAYLPDRAELFDLLFMRELGGEEIILSGTIELNFKNLKKAYLCNLEKINGKVELIKNVW